MPLEKRLGNRIATAVTSVTCGRAVSDAQTGFRAFTRDVALRLNVMSDYTYVQETLIQMAHMNIVMLEVPITFSRRTGGKSRLIGNVFRYARRAGPTILRTYRDYMPMRTFFYAGSLFAIAGLICGLIVVAHYLDTGFVTGKLPTAILSVLLILIGVQCYIIGVLADMLRSHKKVQDEILYRLKKMEYGKGPQDR